MTATRDNVYAVFYGMADESAIQRGIKRDMTFDIQIADTIIRVYHQYEGALSVCHDYIVPPSKSNNLPLIVDVRGQNYSISRGKIIKQEDGMYNFFNPGYIESVYIFHKIYESMPLFDVFGLHGCTIAKGGYAYIFVAPSGTGKSTRAQIWMETYPDSIIVNGDKPLIKITETEAIACGTPWCGKEEWNTNTMVPLRSIFLLERAQKEEESTIQEISFGKAFQTLLLQTYHPSNSDNMRKTVQLLKSLEGKVKFYHFRSSPTPDAIRLAYETARPK